MVLSMSTMSISSIDDLKLTAAVYANGILQSTIEIPETKGIAPQTTKLVKSDALKEAIAKAEAEHAREEITVNFAFASDGSEPLVDKGQVMARQQFVINEYKFDSVTEQTFFLPTVNGLIAFSAALFKIAQSPFLK